MASRPLLIDLYSGAGGASVGYHRAGFEVVGVDIVAQPRYPFTFIQADALDYLRAMRRHSVAAIHASPPCQRYSQMSHCRPGLADTYRDLIGPTRTLLAGTGLPYVIENVPGAPLHNPVTLCGQMFGLELYRHRLFETNVGLPQPLHPAHTKPTSRAGHWKPGTIMSVSGHIAPIAVARAAMGDIDWMTREELAEAVPPPYTHHVGRHLMEITLTHY